MAERSAPQLSLRLAEDKQTMDLTIAGDGKLLAGIVLSAEQLDQMLAALTAIRGHMTPPFPTKLGDAGEARPIKGTHFDFAVDETSRALIFSLRDPELGWLSQRFGVRLLERMLGIARSLEGGGAASPSGTKQ
jgi:hypothetical protein